MALNYTSPATDEDEPGTKEAAVMDLDEFQEARSDPEWQRTLARARAYRAQLELEGRNR